ncbi:EAL domain-containing protein [Hydrogenimonas sp.]
MKRFLTLNFVLFVIFSAIVFTLGYSLHRLKVSFTDNILSQYAKEIDSDLVQLRLNLQTVVNDTGESSVEMLPNILTRYINIHPVTKRLQVYFGERLVADTSFDKNRLSDQARTACLPLQRLTAATIKEGHYCYRLSLRVYRDGRRVPAELVIVLDEERLSTEISETLKKMMVPVGVIMLVVILFTALLFWGTIVRNFARLIRWSDDPSRRPPVFWILEFKQISEKMHSYARKLMEQFELLKESVSRESNLRSIMQTVAKVNELLVTEKDEAVFLQKASEILSRHRNYFGTSIFLENDSGEIEAATSIVSIDDSASVGGASSICIGIDEFRKLKDPSLHHIIRRASECKSCDRKHVDIFFPQRVKDAWVTIFPLRYDTTHPPLGYLVVNSVVKEGFDEEEIDMLSELAGDIGFAIQAFRREKAFETMLYRHPLTGLPNAAAFSVAMREHAGDIIAMANIDRFKQINTLYGVKVADEILKRFADYLAKHLPKEVRLFHHLGDEFILLFPKRYEKYEVEKALAELLQKVEAHIFSYEEVEVLLSVRFGVTLLQNENSLRECHMALKEAKLTHSPIRWYTPNLNVMVKEDMIHTYRLVKEALQEDRVFNCYQGIYAVKERRITHYEALIRLHDADGNTVPPAAFIDFAKQTRLYPQLSARVVQNALRDMKALGTSVSINLSVVDILNDAFCRELFETLENLESEKPIIFEIIESENIENYEKTSAFVQTLKSYGCLVAIDDFGSGYANFQHIAQLDVDMLKIDGTLIKNIVHDRQIRAIVRNIANIARDLGMTTVAEFVANDDILAVVEELGIDTAQGYRLHKPEPLNVILKKKQV